MAENAPKISKVKVSINLIIDNLMIHLYYQVINDFFGENYPCKSLCDVAKGFLFCSTSSEIVWTVQIHGISSFGPFQLLAKLNFRTSKMIHSESQFSATKKILGAKDHLSQVIGH